MMTELRPVIGFEDYQVSDTGQVISTKWGKRRDLKLRLNTHGYPSVSLWSKNIRKTPEIHTLVAQAFIGPRPAGLDIRHLDGNPLNNAVTNLIYGTRAENAQDTILHGTHHQANKTHCKHGHEYTEENTYRQPSRPNQRSCRICHVNRVRESRARERTNEA